MPAITPCADAKSLENCELLSLHELRGGRLECGIKDWASAAEGTTRSRTDMRMRLWIIPCLFLCLLVPAASAKQKKAHPAGSHPKPNHPMSKYKKPKKQKKFKH